MRNRIEEIKQEWEDRDNELTPNPSWYDVGDLLAELAAREAALGVEIERHEELVRLTVDPQQARMRYALSVLKALAPAAPSERREG